MKDTVTIKTGALLSTIVCVLLLFFAMYVFGAISTFSNINYRAHKVVRSDYDHYEERLCFPDSVHLSGGDLYYILNGSTNGMCKNN